MTKNHFSYYLSLALMSFSNALLPPESLIDSLFDWKQLKIIHLKSCSYEDDHTLFNHLAKKDKYLLNIISSSHPPKSAPYKVGAFLDLGCQTNLKYLKEVSSSNIFNDSYSWLLTLQSGSNVEDLHYTSIGLNSDVTLLTTQTFPYTNSNNVTENNTIYLYDVFRHQPNSELIFQMNGVWSESSLHLMPYKRVNSLNGAKLKATMVFMNDIYHEENLFAELLNRSYLPNLDLINRIFFSLEQHMTDFANYTLEIVRTHEWESSIQNGTYTGMVGDLVKGISNLTIGPIQMTSDRREVVEYLTPYLEMTYPVVFKQPRGISSHRALFLQFKFEVWMSVALLILFSVASLSFIFWVKSAYYSPEDRQECEPVVSYSVVAVVGALSLQGLGNSPSDPSGRIACFFILLLGFMISTYYNAATMNALLSATPISIKNLQQFIDTNIPLIIVEKPDNKSKAAVRTEVYYEVLERRTESSGEFNSITDGVREILKGKAFCGDGDSIFREIQNNFTDVEKCDLSIFNAGPNMVCSNMIPKNSPYREIMFRGSIRMREHGLVHRQLRHWRTPKPKCLVNQQWLWVSVETVSLAINIVTYGLALSLIIFFLERIFFYMFTKLHRSSDQSDKSPFDE